MSLRRNSVLTPMLSYYIPGFLQCANKATLSGALLFYGQKWNMAILASKVFCYVKTQSEQPNRWAERASTPDPPSSPHPSTCKYCLLLYFLSFEPCSSASLSSPIILLGNNQKLNMAGLMHCKTIISWLVRTSLPFSISAPLIIVRHSWHIFLKINWD